MTSACRVPAFAVDQLALAILLVAAAILASSGRAAAEVRYNRDVLPILAENCFACHGFDKARREAGLRLDSAAGATAVLEFRRPGHYAGPTGSKRARRADLCDSRRRAYAAGEGGKTTHGRAEGNAAAWVEQGARYESHWAFIPPERSSRRRWRPSTRSIVSFSRRLAEEESNRRPMPIARRWRGG